MKNMQQLYQNAKHCASDKNITAYREAVEEFTSSPKEYIENIQYILPSSIGIKSLQEFVSTHGISIASYQPIVECIQSCIDRCEKNKKDASLYKEALEFMESFKNKYRHNFYMFENFKEDLKPNYAEAYYKNFPVLREGKEVNFSKIIERFGESAIPDMIIYADMFGDSNTVLTPFKERYDRLDTTTKLWLEECEKDLFTEGLLDMIKNIPANIRSRSNVDQPGKENDSPSASLTENSTWNIIHRNERLMQESVILGYEKEISFTESELESIQDLISFKENLITLVESEEERMNLQNEVYDLYESIGDLLDEDVADSVIPMLPGANQNIEIRSINEDWLNNTHNKKTGTTPDYLKNAHDLSWGEDDDTPPKKRPSASDDDKPDDDDDFPSDDKKEKDPLDKIEPFDYDANKSDSSDDKNSDSSKSSQGHIQNYYYYTYNNSNNTHSTTNTNSYNRSQDDHSRNKRTKSHDYGGAKEEKQLWEVELSGIDSYQEGLFGNLFSSSSREILGETSDMKISDIDDGELWKLTSKIKRELCIQIKKLIHEDRRFEYIMNGGAEGAVEQLDRRINDNYLGYDDLLVIQKIQEENTIKYIAYGDMISDVDDQFDEVPVGDKQLIQTAYESLANLPIMEEIETLTEKYGFDLLGPNDIGSDIKKIMRCIPCVGIFSSDSETLSKWWNEYNLRYGESVMYEDSIDDSKPSSDNPIQDTMLDLDRKLSGIQQSVKSKVQGVQRTASAIVKPFKRTSQWITNMVSRWKDANENDLKAKMADPHERSTLLSAFKSAIKYGSLMKAGLLLNPIIMFLTISKKWSDRKNSFRIRNEMIGELKAELEIIEEKIRDADQAQDRSAKYKLMRFRNELKKKLIRVGGTPEMKNII